MALIDINEDEALVIAQAIKSAVRSGEIEDEYTAFNLLQTFKREFPGDDYLFDFLDYEFIKNFEDYE